jgi:hypothetical protein
MVWLIALLDDSPDAGRLFDLLVIAPRGTSDVLPAPEHQQTRQNLDAAV